MATLTEMIGRSTSEPKFPHVEERSLALRECREQPRSRGEDLCDPKTFTNNTFSKMLSILRKARLKDKEMRVLML